MDVGSSLRWFKGRDFKLNGSLSTSSHSKDLIALLGPSLPLEFAKATVLVSFVKCTIARLMLFTCKTNSKDLDGSAGNPITRVFFMVCPGPEDARLCISNSECVSRSEAQS
jgi:hypothetical protein